MKRYIFSTVVVFSALVPATARAQDKKAGPLDFFAFAAAGSGDKEDKFVKPALIKEGVIEATGANDRNACQPPTASGKLSECTTHTSRRVPPAVRPSLLALKRQRKASTITTPPKGESQRIFVDFGKIQLAGLASTTVFKGKATGTLDFAVAIDLDTRHVCDLGTRDIPANKLLPGGDYVSATYSAVVTGGLTGKASGDLQVGAITILPKIAGANANASVKIDLGHLRSRKVYRVSSQGGCGRQPDGVPGDQ